MEAQGFWNLPPEYAVPIKLALIHSEVSEALEANRKGGTLELLGEELADIVIRVMDLAEGASINLGAAIVRKHEKNLNRPFMHGRNRY